MHAMLRRPEPAPNVQKPTTHMKDPKRADSEEARREKGREGAGGGEDERAGGGKGEGQRQHRRQTEAGYSTLADQDHQQMKFECEATVMKKRCIPYPAPFGAVGTQAKVRQRGQAQSVGALGSADRGSKTVGVRRAHMQPARSANYQAWGAGGADEGGKESEE